MKSLIKKKRSNARIIFLMAAAVFAWAMVRGLPTAVSITPAPTESAAPASDAGGLKVEPFYPGKGQSALMGISGGLLDKQVMAKVTMGDKPQAGIPVVFEMHPEKAGKITETTVSTDKDGIAVTSLDLGSSHGDFVVTAAAQGADKKAEINVKIYAGMWVYLMIFGTLGGLAIFLYGMEMSAEGLQKAAGDKMRVILGKLTSNRFMGVIVGTLVTGAVQSSSASTVMVVGFVTATLMTLPQAIGVIFGANIGTTLTVQLIAFNISDYAPLMIAVGFFMIMLGGKRQVMRNVGEIILGFGFIFFGMGAMSSAMKPLRSVKGFIDLLVMCGDKPWLGILLSAVFTAIVQSSGATIGIAIALAASGILTLPAAIAIAFGSNIGTCATAMLSSLGASREGKRVALVHLFFNVLGVVIFFPFLGLFARGMVKVTTMMGSTSLVRQIANAHMFFNIINAAIFLPFVNQLAAIVTKLIPDIAVPAGEVKFTPQFLEGGVNNPPDIALEQGFRETERMAGITLDMFRGIIDTVINHDQAAALAVKDEDNKVDILEEALTKYFSQVSRKELSGNQSEEIITYMSVVDYLEKIGDTISKELAQDAVKLSEAKAALSEEQQKVIRMIHGRVLELFEKTMAGFSKHDIAPAEESMLLYTKLKAQMRKTHNTELQRMAREQQSEDASALTVLYFDLIESLRTIASSVNQMAQSITEQF